MKKYLFLSLILGAMATSVQAQHAVQSQNATQASEQAAMLKKMKEQFKPQMLEQTKLTEAQIDRVIEINFEIRMMATAFRDLSEEERSKKITELKALKEKKYSEIPLTSEEIASVYSFFESLGKNAPKKSGK